MTVVESSANTAAWVWILTPSLGVVRADQLARLRAGLDPSCMTLESRLERWGVYLTVIGHGDSEYLVTEAADLREAEEIMTALLNTVYVTFCQQSAGIVRVNENRTVIFENFTTDLQ